MVAWGKLLEKAQNGDFQMFYLAWFVGLPTGFQFFDLLYGPNWPGSYNRMGHTDPEFDQLFDGAMASVDPIVHETHFNKMNKIALKNVPLFPLVHARDFFLKQGWLKNYVPSEATGGLEQYFDIDIAVKKELLKRF
jgi:ABC-type transport system substrate-binding protein